MFILSLLSSLLSYAQEEKPKLCVRLTPLSLIDLYSGSSYRGGLEFSLGKHTSLYQEAGGYFKNFNGLSNIQGYVLKSQFRFYPDPKESVYIALEYFYKRQSYTFGDSLTSPFSRYTDFSVDKYITAITIQSGTAFPLNDRIRLEVFGGIGVRFKNVHNTLTDEEESKCFYMNDSMSLPLMNKEKKGIVPNLDFGVKVVFVLMNGSS